MQNIKVTAGHFFILNVAALTLYFVIITSFGFPKTLDAVMFSSGDSREYRDYTYWLKGETAYCSPVRPFLYPLLLLLSNSIAGIYGIWFMQFCFWLLSVNLLFYSLLKLTRHTIIASIGAFIFSANISMLLQTMHALTEVTVVFLLSLFIYYITRYHHKRNTAGFISVIVLIVSTLTVIKPVFYLLLIGLLVIVLPVWYLKYFIQKKKYFLALFVCLLPVIIQMTIMKVKHNRFAVSHIGFLTVRDYYYPKLFSLVNNVPLEQARIQAKNATGSEILNYVLQYPGQSIKTYFKTVKDNIDSHSEYIDRKEHMPYTRFMENVNTGYYYLHVLFIALLLLTAVYLRKSRSESEAYFYLLLVPTVFIIFTSAISFDQGDRLVLPALPLWIVLYTFTGWISYAVLFNRSKVNAISSQLTSH